LRKKHEVYTAKYIINQITFWISQWR